MKGAISVKSKIDPGTYEGRLDRITGTTATKFKAAETEPVLHFWWTLGQDESGATVTLIDSFIRLLRDVSGAPVLNDGSKLYNRISALYGSRFNHSGSDSPKLAS